MKRATREAKEERNEDCKRVWRSVVATLLSGIRMVEEEGSRFNQSKTPIKT
jgi:hypothetical protein